VTTETEGVKKIAEKREGHGKTPVKERGEERQKGEKERANSPRTCVCVCSGVGYVCSHSTIANDSEPHRQSLEGSGGFLGVCALYSSRTRRWSCTTAFAFFGEVKAVSGKFW